MRFTVWAGRRGDTDEHAANMSSRLHMGQKRFGKLGEHHIPQAISCVYAKSPPTNYQQQLISARVSFFFPYIYATKGVICVYVISVIYATVNSGEKTALAYLLPHTRFFSLIHTSRFYLLPACEEKKIYIMYAIHTHDSCVHRFFSVNRTVNTYVM